MSKQNNDAILWESFFWPKVLAISSVPVALRGAKAFCNVLAVDVSCVKERSRKPKMRLTAALRPALLRSICEKYAKHSVAGGTAR